MPGEILPRQVWNQQTKFTCNYWVAASVKEKWSSTKPARLTIGVVCQPVINPIGPQKLITLSGIEPLIYYPASENSTSMPTNPSRRRILERFVTNHF